jgi:hypothetical protein
MSILDSSVEMDMVKLYEDFQCIITFHGLKLDLEILDWVHHEVIQDWVYVRYFGFKNQPMKEFYACPRMSTLEEWMPTLEKVMKLAESLRRFMSFKEFHSRYSHDPIISQFLEKIKRISGFLLGVVVLFMFQYLMGYVETGRWNTYSNGTWEFRANYVCIELRLGSYPFQKFRVTPRRFGVKTINTKNGVSFEPWVSFRNRKIYFEVQKTENKAAKIRDVAKFCLKIKGRKGYNFGEEQYTSLSFFQEFLPQQSDDEIKRLVLVYAKPFLNEVQVSQEVPIVDQPPCVEPVRLASKHIKPWSITF